MEPGAAERLLIPDGALPLDLRGTPGPSGGLDPYIPELFR